MRAEVCRLKDVSSKLKSKEANLQDLLFANENLKKELDKLYDAYTGLIEDYV